MSLTTWLANGPCMHTPSTGVTRLGHHLWLFSYGQWEWNSGPHACSTSTLATDPSPQPLELGKNQKKSYLGLPWVTEGESTVTTKKHPTEGKQSYHNTHPLEMSLSVTASLRKSCGSALDTCSGHTHTSCTPTSSTQRQLCCFYSFSLNPVRLRAPALVRACPAAFFGGPR